MPITRTARIEGLRKLIDRTTDPYLQQALRQELAYQLSWCERCDRYHERDEHIVPRKTSEGHK